MSKSKDLDSMSRFFEGKKHRDPYPEPPKWEYYVVEVEGLWICEDGRRRLKMKIVEGERSGEVIEMEGK